MQMAGQQFNMGQIIYILSNKTQSVVPAVIDEQVVRKVRRSDGIHEVISYKLSIGPKERQQSVDLSKIDGEVFSSLEAVKATLLERLTGFIDELVRTTQKNVMNWYGIDSENQFNQEFDNGTKLDPAQILETMNSGLTIQKQQSQPSINPHMSIRDNIRTMVEDPEDGMQGLGIPGNQGPQTVILEDGTKVQVNLN
jgi:predicted transcriptional regulator with HTH domain